MHTLTRQEVEALAAKGGGPWVSLYEPVGLTNQAKQAAAIRLKDRLRQCEAALADSGMRATDASALVAPVATLIDEKLSGLPACRGLALFISPAERRFEALPIEVEDVAWVGPRPYVRPLMGIVRQCEPYWLLAISQNKARVFHGGEAGMSEVAIPDMPTALDDVVADSGRDGTRQAHSAGPDSSARHDSAFHGQGGMSDHRKANITKYFQQVDRALQAHLRGDVAPLLFAGVAYLYPLYAEVSHHPHLLAAHLGENPDRESADELHRRAEQLLRPLWERKQVETLQSLERALGTDEASDELHVVLPAAAAGQVKALVVRQARPLWGKFDASTGKVHVDHEQLPGSEDLLDRACAEVLRHGGDVYPVPWQQIKSGAPLAAIFRYAPAPLASHSVTR